MEVNPRVGIRAHVVGDVIPLDSCVIPVRGWQTRTAVRLGTAEHIGVSNEGVLMNINFRETL